MKLALRGLASRVAVGILFFAGYGCTTIAVDELPANADPSAQIDKLDAERTDAYNNQINVLAPVSYGEASDKLKDAKASRSAGKDSKVILQEVAEGFAYLKKANQEAQISKSTLGDVVQARADALTAGAPKAFEVEFAEADHILTNSTKNIEDNDLSTAEKYRGQLKKDYADLELRAIKKTTLGDAKSKIDAAVKEGADKTATRTLAETKKVESEADAYISANRHDKAGIQAQANAATAAADRLLSVTRQAKVVGKTDAEALVLQNEAAQKRVTDEQAAVQRQQSELAAAHGANAQLETQNSQLTTEKQFQERLQTAKAAFSPSEADVLRDGNRLIVRIKSMAFPTGKSTLAPASFPVLAKVNKVIKDLGTSHVTVQGYTDSTGKKDANQKLSEERAAAIGTYLTANGVPAGSLTTVGLGDSNPIAPNNTKDGRALNRRVDVIVEPTGLTH